MSLIIDALHKRYGKRTAVEKVSFQIQPGEVYALIGPNGAGKTTTIKSLLGLCRPDRGSSLWKDRPVVHAMENQKVGYMPERLTFKPFLTPRTYLYSQSVVRGLKYREETVDDLLASLDLDERKQSYLGTLSKGMSRKISFIQAVFHEPELLVLDEPTDGLDPVARRKTLDLIRDFSSRGMAVLITSHLLADLERVADRVGIIVGGSLAGETSPSELASQSIHRAVITDSGGRKQQLELELGAKVSLSCQGTVECLEHEGQTLEDWYHEVVREVGANAAGN